MADDWFEAIVTLKPEPPKAADLVAAWFVQQGLSVMKLEVGLLASGWATQFRVAFGMSDLPRREAGVERSLPAPAEIAEHVETIVIPPLPEPLGI